MSHELRRKPQGMIEWAALPWHEKNWRYKEEFGLVPDESTAAFLRRLYQARSAATLRITRKIRGDMEHRFGFTAHLLGLPGAGGELADRFLESGFIEGHFEQRDGRKAKR